MFDIIGDPHGCFAELAMLFDKLGYILCEDNLYRHPQNRIPVFVGDLVSRGPNSIAVIYLIRDMIKANLSLSVIGNHDNKIFRYCLGNKVKLTHGDDGTAQQIEDLKVDKGMLIEFFSSLPYFLKLDEEKLIVAHASFRDELINEDGFSKRCKDTCLYGPQMGMDKELGIPNRIEWVSKRKYTPDLPFIVYGHQPGLEPRVENGTCDIDTGCVFGNKLSSFSWPEKIVTQVDALRSYSGKVGEWRITTK